MKVFPPIKRNDDRAALKEALREGTICSVGSDHAPHTGEEKQRSLAGGSGRESGGRDTCTGNARPCSRGAPQFEQVAWLLSEGTARLYRLHPAKGAMEPGADADFTLVDPEERWTIRSSELHSKSRMTPWEGASGYGVPAMAFVRGREVMRAGRPTGEPVGRFVRPRPGDRRTNSGSTRLYGRA